MNNYNDIVDGFSNYFKSVYRVSSDNFVTQTDGSLGVVSSLSISHSELLIKKCKFDIEGGCGPDGVPPKLLKECAFVLTPIPCHIFKEFLVAKWKTCYIMLV